MLRLIQDLFQDKEELTRMIKKMPCLPIETYDWQKTPDHDKSTKPRRASSCPKLGRENEEIFNKRFALLSFWQHAAEKENHSELAPEINKLSLSSEGSSESSLSDNVDATPKRLIEQSISNFYREIGSVSSDASASKVQAADPDGVANRVPQGNAFQLATRLRKGINVDDGVYRKPPKCSNYVGFSLEGGLQANRSKGSEQAAKRVWQDAEAELKWDAMLISRVAGQNSKSVRSL